MDTNQKKLAVATMIWLMMVQTGCTSQRVVELPPEELQRQIMAGEWIEAGDKIEVTTLDGKRHQLTVIGVENGVLVTEEEHIPVDSILTLESRHFSVGKTLALVGGGLGAGVIIAGIALATLWDSAFSH